MRIEWRALGAGETDHERLWLAVAAACVLVAGLVAAGVQVPVIVCPVKVFTGWPCLGCGASRAVWALAGGSLGSALRWNPLVTLVLVGWGVWALYASIVLAFGLARLRLVGDSATRTIARWSAAFTALAVWVFLVIDGR